MPKRGTSKVKSLPNGRFRLNNRKKRKSKGTSNNHRKPENNGQFPELMDLENGVFIPEIGSKVPKHSMRNLGRRPEKHLMKEVSYTNEHRSETMNLPLRKRPIEFVKAKEVYDPNNELGKEDALKEEILQDLQDINIDDSDEEESVEEVDEEDEQEEEVDEGDDEEDDEEVKEEAEVEDEEDKEESEQQEQINDNIQNDQILIDTTPSDLSKTESDFIIDDEGDESLATSVKPKTALLIDSDPDSDHIEKDNVLNIGKVSLQTKYENGEMYTELLSAAQLKKIKPGFVKESRSLKLSDNDDDFEDEDDPQGYQDYINEIMRQLKEESDEYESDTNFDMMAEDSDVEDANDTQKSELDSPEDSDSSKDPEYGFLEEDYAFDVSKISVSNIRYGVHNSYYTKCEELLGSMEPSWVEEDDIADYILENGVPEHRLNSFFKFITKGLVDDEPEIESDVYISESSEDESEDETDGLDDLINYVKNQTNNNPFDIEPTSSLPTKGKGKKKQLDFDQTDLDNDLREALQEQYLSQRHAKKLRKQLKEDEATQKGIASHDLLIKYPYTLHIKDIKYEMEVFLQDSSRTALKFPPLDPHGNKTVKKMAECFNFKCKRAGGNGLKSFMEVIKTKRTFQYLPNHNAVYAITRQRPVFNRIDVKRPKDTYLETDGNKDKDRRRGRNKTSNANVKEGDIVGEKAPEIPSDNIGRQLLERMGWIKGTGLGLDNRGINEPVIAKIKTTKLGLK